MFGLDALQLSQSEIQLNPNLPPLVADIPKCPMNNFQVIGGQVTCMWHKIGINMSYGLGGQNQVSLMSFLTRTLL